MFSCRAIGVDEQPHANHPFPFGASRSDILSTSRFIFFKSTPCEPHLLDGVADHRHGLALHQGGGDVEDVPFGQPLPQKFLRAAQGGSSASATSRSRTFTRGRSRPDTSPNCFANASSRSGSLLSRTLATFTSNTTVFPAYFGTGCSAGKVISKARVIPGADPEHLFLELPPERDAVGKDDRHVVVAVHRFAARGRREPELRQIPIRAFAPFHRA